VKALALALAFAAVPPALLPGAPSAVLTGPGQSLLAITYSPDGGALVVTGLDRTVRAWAMPSQAPLAALDGGENPVDALAFSPDGTRLAYGDQAFWARVVTWPSLAPAGEVIHPSAVVSLAFSPKADRLAVSSPSGTGGLYAATGGKQLAEVRSRCAAFRADGASLVTAQISGALSVVDVKTGKVRSSFSTNGHVPAVLVLADDQTALTASPKDAEIRVWDLKAGKALRVFRGHGQGVHSLSLSADRTLLASTGVDRTVRVWDVKSGRELWQRPVEYSAFAALSPDGKTVAVADGAVVKLWPVTLDADAGTR